jgi:hypothetical protein
VLVEHALAGRFDLDAARDPASDHRICMPDMALAITSRWISDVPSKIV